MSFASWLDFLYPPACALCRDPLSEGCYLCDGCRADLPRIEKPFCIQCGEHIEGFVPEECFVPSAGAASSALNSPGPRALPTTRRANSCTPTSTADRSTCIVNSPPSPAKSGTTLGSPPKLIPPGSSFQFHSIGADSNGAGSISPTRSPRPWHRCRAFAWNTPCDESAIPPSNPFSAGLVAWPICAGHFVSAAENSVTNPCKINPSCCSMMFSQLVLQ